MKNSDMLQSLGMSKPTKMRVCHRLVKHRGMSKIYEQQRHDCMTRLMSQAYDKQGYITDLKTKVSARLLINRGVAISDQIPLQEGF